MKLLLILLGIVAAGVIGYRMEPTLRFQLTGTLPKDLAAKLPAPEATKPPALDPASLTPEQLPEKVTLHAEVKVSDSAGEVTMTIPAGTRVKLVRIDETNAVVSPGEGPYSGTLPISQTDLMEQLAANPPSSATPPAPTPTDPLAGDPASPPAPTPDPTPAVDPAPTPTGDSEEPAPMPEPAVDPQPESTPDPTPAEPEPTPPAAEPEPTPTPTSVPAATTSGSAAVVKVMQASIRNGQIKEFAFNQVLSWKAEANETVDGEVFQTGTVTYKAETIFGVKTIQAKALIKGGKVQRWIWPKSGMQIK